MELGLSNSEAWLASNQSESVNNSKASPKFRNVRYTGRNDGAVK